MGRIASIRLAIVTGAALAALRSAFPQDKTSIGDSANRLIVRGYGITGRDAHATQMWLLDKPDTQRVVVGDIAVSELNFASRSEGDRRTGQNYQQNKPQRDQSAAADSYQIL